MKTTCGESSKVMVPLRECVLSATKRAGVEATLSLSMNENET